MNRKGVGGERSKIIDIIILLAGFILLVMFFMKVVEKADPATQDAVCRASVMLRSKAAIEVGFIKKDMLTPLACPSREVKIKGSREEIKKQIAELSAKCWWKFAEGSIPDLLKKDEYEYGCKVCYIFELEKEMDKGIIPQASQQFFQEPTRETDKISWQEMYNYMFFNFYNPALVYGGGTKEYMGDSYPSASASSSPFDINANLVEPRKIKPSSINYRDVQSYVLDLSYVFKGAGESSDENIKRIEEAAAELKQKTGKNLLVIIADSFTSFDKVDGINIIERLQLNSNPETKDAVLIMVDVYNNKIRVVIGLDNIIYLKEYEIYEILSQEFEDVDSVDSAKEALADVTEKIVNKLMNKAEAQAIKDYNINPRSYYYYISNAGFKAPWIGDIEKGKRYAIAYQSPTNKVPWWESFIYVSEDGNWYFLWIDSLIHGSFWINLIGGKIIDKPNNIIIMDVNSISQYCQVE